MRMIINTFSNHKKKMVLRKKILVEATVEQTIMVTTQVLIITIDSNVESEPS